MTTYVTTLSRSLTSFSYMIGTIIQKLSLRTSISYYGHCGKERDYYPWERPFGRSYSHCGKDRNYYPLERPIGRGYGSHCGKD